MQYYPRPKHLPRLVPKRDKLTRPKRVETDVACDGEGVLLRRKWKEKPDKQNTMINWRICLGHCLVAFSGSAFIFHPGRLYVYERAAPLKLKKNS